jgi:hypothetical protein
LHALAPPVRILATMAINNADDDDDEDGFILSLEENTIA